MINLKQLLTENTAPKEKIMEAADHVRSGLEKVFAAGSVEISYRQCENVGLGYIKSISEAMKVASTEARVLAKTFGYRADESKKKFIKEDNDFSKINAQDPTSGQTKVASNEQPHDETDMSSPEESREVQIAKEIKDIVNKVIPHVAQEAKHDFLKLKVLAEELLTMHETK